MLVLPWFIFESWGNLLSISFLTFIKGVNSTWWAIKILESSLCWQWNRWVLLSPKHTYSGEYIWRTTGLEVSRTSSHLIFFLFWREGLAKIWVEKWNYDVIVSITFQPVYESYFEAILTPQPDLDSHILLLMWDQFMV